MPFDNSQYPPQAFGNEHVQKYIPATPVPVLATAAGAGTSPPVPTLGANARDAAGDINWGTGTSPAAGQQVVVTFAQAFSIIPNVEVDALNAATAGLNVYVSAKSKTGFTISSVSAPAASQSATTYLVQYTAFNRA